MHLMCGDMLQRPCFYDERSWAVGIQIDALSELRKDLLAPHSTSNTPVSVIMLFKSILPVLAAAFGLRRASESTHTCTTTSFSATARTLRYGTTNKRCARENLMRDGQAAVLYFRPSASRAPASRAMLSLLPLWSFGLSQFIADVPVDA